MDYGKMGRWMERCLIELGECSQVDGGIWRAVYTEQEAAGKRLLSQWIEEAGLICYEDSLGNLYGKLPGKRKDAGTVLVGSHIDTVKDGGRYDGAAGVLAGIAALGALKEAGFRLECDLEVVGLLEEEGSRYPSSCHGSRGIVGSLRREHLEETDRDGISFAEAMRRTGRDPERFGEAKRDDILAYVELHIEQGAVLEQNQKQIGIVDGIVGIVNYDVTIRGQQNHAGTTPMDLRKDPVVEAAVLIGEMTEQIRSGSPGTTATFGKIQSFPGMQNVIAGDVFFTLDMRSGSRETLMRQEAWFLRRLAEMERRGFSVEAVQTQWTDPVGMDDRLIGLLRQAAEELGFPAMRLYSGAGHDAMVFGECLPIAMVFVPSRDGISHNCREYTSPEDLQAGFEVLCGVLPMITQQFA